MVRLVVKSPYIPCNGGNAGGYMKYIATRENVEKYAQYIAERPGSHGLFGDDDMVDLQKAMDELKDYTGNVWTHIISLHREDAVRYGYDHADAWRNLIRSHRNEIAEAMHISPEHFRWYAAFHNEGDHPHIHMMAWSTDSKEAYLNRDGIKTIKSELANDIFAHEMVQLYEQKSEARQDLVAEARRAMRELAREMQSGFVDFPEQETLMQQLAEQLKTVRGKHSYLSNDEEVRDTAQGIRWLEAAAELGSSDAAYLLGKLYLPKGREKAVQYFEQAASQDNPCAQYMLGKIFLAEHNTERGMAYME